MRILTTFKNKTVPVSLMVALLFLMNMDFSYGQSFLGLDGGLEGSATIDNATNNTVPQAGTWAKNTSQQTIASETSTVRSGSKAIRINSTSTTGRRVWSPNFTISSTTSNVTVQYFKRVANITDAQEDQPGLINNTEGISGAYNAFPSVANTWVKVTYTKASSTFTTVAGLLLHRKIGSGGDMFIDDMCVYTGAVDVTAPNLPGSLTVNNPSPTSLDLSWGAASGGVDNGGYLVMRYSVSPNADNDPNQFGIYATGNTTTNGTGSLTGTVRYIGTGTSFTDNVGLSSGTTYYYKVYTYDKAYNYSTEVSGNGTTSAVIPTLTTSTGSLTFGSQNVLTTSSSQSFNLSGSLLSPSSGNITVNAPNTDWTVSIDNSSFGATATIGYTGAAFTNTPVYVKFNPQTAGSKTGINITFSGGSVSSPPTVALTGTATVPTPTNGAASNIACTSFDANWSSVTGADNYRLDVSINSSFSATPTLASDGFENSLNSFTETTGTGTFSTGSTVSGTDLPGNSPYANSGTYGYGKTNGSVTITSGNINTTATSANQMTFKLASFSVGSIGNGADAGDIATIEISPDGGTTYYSTVRVLGNGNAVWGYSATGIASTAYDGDGTPVNFSPAGGGVRTTDGYSTVTVTSLPSTINLKVRITLLNNASSERWTIDDFLVSGSSTAFVTGYQDLSVGNVITYPVNTNLTANTTYYYRVRAENNSVPSANSSTASALVTSSGVWIGTNSGTNNWFDAVNWCGTLPTAATNVTITSGTPFAPALTGSGALAQSISIGLGATLDINGGSLTPSSDITNNGTLTIGAGGTLDMASNQVVGTGTVVVNGTLETSKAAGFSGSASTTIMNTITSLTLGNASTIDYKSGGSQTITAGNYANLTNSGNGDRTLDNSGTVGISAALTPGSGNYTIGTSTVEFNGSSAQSIPALPVASGANYNNLTLNNSAGAILAANVDLKDALTLTSGAFDVNGNTLTLLSSATQTARIAPVTGGSFVGDVTMQRFVPGSTAGWATIGMPVTGSTIAAWTDDIVTSGFTGSTTGTGTFISIYSYDETELGLASSTASYVAVSDATNSVDPKKGYFVFVADNATTVADKLLDVTGPPLSGSQNMNVTFSSTGTASEDGWNLLSNPYCSAIDWLSPAWTKVNMDDAVYIYNADAAQYTGSVNGVSYLGGNELIASSQSFFVHANAASPSLIAAETVKTAVNPVFYRSSNAVEAGVLRLKLDGLNGTYMDETVIRTKVGATNNFDGAYDAYKLYSFDPAAPNISTKVNGIEYVVNAVDEITSNLDLPVRVNVNTPGSYTINFKGLQNFSNVTCFTFEDLLTNTSIDLNTDSSYTFTSFLDTASASPRFVLHFGVEAIVPVVTPSATTVSLQVNPTVNFVNTSTGASNYSWNFGDGSALETSANPSHTYTVAGTYTVTLLATNNAGCSQSTTVTITVNNVTGVNQLAAAESIFVGRDAQGVYANYNFKNSTKVKVVIYNALGAQVSSTQYATVQNSGRLALDTRELAKGIYTFEMVFEDKKITQKLDF